MQLEQSGPDHAAADGEQQRAQHQRGSGLEAVMSVGVVGVGLFLRVVAGKQHHKIGHEIGQRVHAVGHQTLRTRQQADHDLRARQQQVDDCADPGAAGGGRCPLLRAVTGVFGVVVVYREIHGGGAVAPGAPGDCEHIEGV